MNFAKSPQRLKRGVTSKSMVEVTFCGKIYYYYLFLFLHVVDSSWREFHFRHGRLEPGDFWSISTKVWMLGFFGTLVVDGGILAAILDQNVEEDSQKRWKAVVIAYIIMHGRYTICATYYSHTLNVVHAYETLELVCSAKSSEHRYTMHVRCLISTYQTSIHATQYARKFPLKVGCALV